MQFYVQKEAGSIVIWYAWTGGEITTLMELPRELAKTVEALEAWIDAQKQAAQTEAEELAEFRAAKDEFAVWKAARTEGGSNGART